MKNWELSVLHWLQQKVHGPLEHNLFEMSHIMSWFKEKKQLVLKSLLDQMVAILNLTQNHGRFSAIFAILLLAQKFFWATVVHLTQFVMRRYYFM